MAMVAPGKRTTCLPSAMSQAAATAKQGLRNSLGWICIPGRAIQRRAPLISTPATSVIAVRVSATTQPISAMRRTSRGDSSDTPTTMAPAMPRNSTCLRMNMSREI